MRFCLGLSLSGLIAFILLLAISRWALSLGAPSGIGPEVLVQIPVALAAIGGMGVGVVTAFYAYRNYQSWIEDRVQATTIRAQERTWDQRDHRAAWRELNHLVESGRLEASLFVEFCLSAACDHIRRTKPADEDRLSVSSAQRADDAMAELWRILTDPRHKDLGPAAFPDVDMRQDLNIRIPTLPDDGVLDLSAVFVGAGVMRIESAGATEPHVVLPRRIGPYGRLDIVLSDARAGHFGALTTQGQIDLQIASAPSDTPLVGGGSVLQLENWTIDSGGTLTIDCEAPGSTLTMFRPRLEGEVSFRGEQERWLKTAVVVDQPTFGGAGRVHMGNLTLADDSSFTLKDLKDDRSSRQTRLDWTKVTLLTDSRLVVEDVLGQSILAELPEISNSGGTLELKFVGWSAVYEGALSIAKWRLLPPGVSSTVHVEPSRQLGPNENPGIVTFDLRGTQLDSPLHVLAPALVVQLVMEPDATSRSSIEVHAKRLIPSALPDFVTHVRT